MNCPKVELIKRFLLLMIICFALAFDVQNRISSKYTLMFFCAQREVVIWEVVVLSSISWLYEKMIWGMTVIMSAT